MTGIVIFTPLAVALLLSAIPRRRRFLMLVCKCATICPDDAERCEGCGRPLFLGASEKRLLVREPVGMGRPVTQVRRVQRRAA